MSSISSLANKENEDHSNFTPRRSLASSLLFVSNLDDSPGSEDEEITFKPSKKRGLPPSLRNSTSAPTHSIPLCEVVPISLDNGARSSPSACLVDDSVQQPVSSRFELVSAKLDEWKKAMADFGTHTTVVPASSPHTEEANCKIVEEQSDTLSGQVLPRPSETMASEDKVLDLVFDFSEEPALKARKKPAFVPGRHSQQLQEARALKRAAEQQQQNPEVLTSPKQELDATCVVEEVRITTGPIACVVSTQTIESQQNGCEHEQQEETEDGAETNEERASVMRAKPEFQDPTPTIGTSFPLEEAYCADVRIEEAVQSPDLTNETGILMVETTAALSESADQDLALLQYAEEDSEKEIVEVVATLSPEPKLAASEFSIPCTPLNAKSCRDERRKPEADLEELALLRERLAAMTSTNRHLENVIRGYEETFEQLVREEQQKFEEEQRLRIALQDKNRELLEDMQEITKSFELMKSRYEDFKSGNEALQRQVDELRRASEESGEALHEAEAGQEAWAARFEALKRHAQERLTAANAEIEALQQSVHAKDDTIAILHSRESALSIARRKEAAAWEARSKIAESRMASIERERNELLVICEQLMGSLESPPQLAPLPVEGVDTPVVCNGV